MVVLNLDVDVLVCGIWGFLVLVGSRLVILIEIIVVRCVVVCVSVMGCYSLVWDKFFGVC